MDLFDPNNVLLWRALERLINVLIGALSILLGYRLFMNLPEKREDQQGKMKLLLPGDISVYISRVGPGIFFALFGSAIILTSFVKTLSYTPVNLPASTAPQQSAGSERPAPPPQTAMISYVSGKVEDARFSSDRAAVQRDLLTLNKLERALTTAVEKSTTPALSSSESATLLNTLQRVKRSLLLEVWDDSWGDREAFSRWVQEGAFGPPPAGTEKAAGLFRLDGGEP